MLRPALITHHFPSGQAPRCGASIMLTPICESVGGCTHSNLIIYLLYNWKLRRHTHTQTYIHTQSHTHTRTHQYLSWRRGSVSSCPLRGSGGRLFAAAPLDDAFLKFFPPGIPLPSLSCLIMLLLDRCNRQDPFLLNTFSF